MRVRSVILVSMLYCILSGFSQNCFGKNGSKQDFAKSLPFYLSVETPTAENKQVFQQLNYCGAKITKATIRLNCFRLKAADSSNLYDLTFNARFDLNHPGSIKLFFNKNKELKHVDQEFLDVIRQLDIVPPGHYMLNVYVVFKDSAKSVFKHIEWDIDSTLEYNSKLRNQVNNWLTPRRANVLGIFKKPRLQLKDSSATNQNAFGQLERKLLKKGVTTVPEIYKTKAYLSFYHKGVFIGRYPADNTRSSAERRVAEEAKFLNDKPWTFLRYDTASFSNVTSQSFKLNRKRDNKKEISGNVDLVSNFASGRETGSVQDPNSEELRGNINTEILNIPIVIDGYYTTQDMHRQAKASFIRIHYDAEKAKSNLKRNIDNYKNAFNAVQNYGGIIDNTYKGSIDALKEQERLLIYLFGKDYHVDGAMLSEYNGDVDRMLRSPDTARLLKYSAGPANNDKIREKRENLRQNKTDIKKRYERLDAIRKKIARYNNLINQHKEECYLDSLTHYEKIAHINESEQSYRQMAKATSGALPGSKATKFINGLTELDAGIINKYASGYTMAGQNLKGASLGYDFGFVRTSVAVGKTEYISRSGSVDKYNTYMGRAEFEPIRNQKMGLVYYRYSPTKQMLVDNSFFHSDIALPAFQNPVHIISADYTAVAAKGLYLQTEAATSFRNRLVFGNLNTENSAVKAVGEYEMGIVPVSLKGEWERVGKYFENNTLPFTKAGTERYTVETHFDLFKSFLTVGVQYNKIKQSTFYTTGFNTKWGFEFKTHSKQYPSVYFSYKPYSTFRVYADTLSVPQRPVFGEIWIGRLNYRIKKGNRSHNFMLLYNQSSSTSDTVKYDTRTIQGTYLLNSGMLLLNSSIGYLNMPVMNTMKQMNAGSYFINCAASRAVNKLLSASLGQDISFNKSSVIRTAVTAGIVYAWQRVPVAIRIQARYTSYAKYTPSEYRRFFSTTIGLNWKFKTSYGSDRESAF